MSCSLSRSDATRMRAPISQRYGVGNFGKLFLRRTNERQGAVGVSAQQGACRAVPEELVFAGHAIDVGKVPAAASSPSADRGACGARRTAAARCQTVTLLKDGNEPAQRRALVVNAWPRPMTFESVLLVAVPLPFGRK